MTLCTISDYKYGVNNTIDYNIEKWAAWFMCWIEEKE